MYKQGLLPNGKESLIQNDCHCGDRNCTSYDPNILVSTPNDALLVLIDSSRAMNAKRNIATGLTSILIVNRYK